jgi:hypothetical protein
MHPRRRFDVAYLGSCTRGGARFQDYQCHEGDSQLGPPDCGRCSWRALAFGVQGILGEPTHIYALSSGAFRGSIYTTFLNAVGLRIYRYLLIIWNVIFRAEPTKALAIPSVQYV